jgi:hypothetical protein
MGFVFRKRKVSGIRKVFFFFLFCFIGERGGQEWAGVVP